MTVMFGSSKTISPPWGGPERLGLGLLKFIVASLERRNFEVTVWDPLELKLPVLETPHFFYPPGEAPEHLNKMAKTLEDSDCFVFVSPEYNHAIPPALANLIDHFGIPNYAYKASGIVCYSPGPFGGMSMAMQLRSMTAILGCPSVAKIFGCPEVHKSFNADGTPMEDPETWDKRADEFINQLEWHANAMKNHRALAGTP